MLTTKKPMTDTRESNRTIWYYVVRNNKIVRLMEWPEVIRWVNRNREGRVYTADTRYHELTDITATALRTAELLAQSSAVESTDGGW